jgi:hypothetical protein
MSNEGAEDGAGVRTSHSRSRSFNAPDIYGAPSTARWGGFETYLTEICYRTLAKSPLELTIRDFLFAVFGIPNVRE